MFVAQNLLFKENLSIKKYFQTKTCWSKYFRRKFTLSNQKNCRSKYLSTKIYLSAFLKDVAVPLVVVARGSGLGEHVRDVERRLVQLLNINWNRFNYFRRSIVSTIDTDSATYIFNDNILQITEIKNKIMHLFDDCMFMWYQSLVL